MAAGGAGPKRYDNEERNSALLWANCPSQKWPPWRPPEGTSSGSAFDLVGGARGIRTAPRGTSRRRRPTEQVISPPAPGLGLGERQRALTQGTSPGVPYGTPLGRDGGGRTLSLIVSVACMEEHLACSGLSRHVTHPLPKLLLHPCVLRPAILEACECPADGYKKLLLQGSAISGMPLPVLHLQGLCTCLTLDGGIPCSPQCPWYLWDLTWG